MLTCLPAKAGPRYLWPAFLYFFPRMRRDRRALLCQFVATNSLAEASFPFLPPYRQKLAGKKGRTGRISRFAVILLPAKILRLFESGSVFNNRKVLLCLAGKIWVLSWQQKSLAEASFPFLPPYRQKLAGKKGRTGRISRFAVNIGH